MLCHTINRIEIYRVDGGWRDWVYIRVSSTSGQFGVSEITESNGSISALLSGIGDLSRLIMGESYKDVGELSTLMKRAVRQSLPGTLWKASAGLENALWDLLSKELEVPIAVLLNRDLPQNILAPVYWSHCPTSRIRAFRELGIAPITSNQHLVELGTEVSALGFTAIKSNIFNFGVNPIIRMPGFAKNLHDLRSEITEDDIDQFSKSIKQFSSSMNSIEIILDLNFNVGLNQFLRLQEKIDGLPIRWLEIDFDDVNARDAILNVSIHPICTGENILGLYGFNSVLIDDRIDVVSIDLLWNGLSESVRIMNSAITNGKRVTIHNYYSAIASSMALVFFQLIPESARELLEFDYDDVPWRDEFVVNHPVFKNGMLAHRADFGWGVSLDFQKVAPYVKQHVVFES